MKEISIGKHISSIYRHQSIVINSLLKDLSLSSGQYLFLMRVGEHPDISQKDLSDLIQIDRANTNRAIKKLESLGYVKTTPDPDDRRNKRSHLTSKGHLIRDEVIIRLQRVTELLSKDIEASELLQFINTIEKIEANIQDAVKQLREDSHDD